MSFVGYLRPLVQGTKGNSRRRLPAFALAGGFVSSAVLIHAFLWIVGRSLDSVLPLSSRWLGLAIVALIITAVDLIFGKNLRPALSWNRQTPRQAFFAFGPTRGALLWGLDTGLGFTTYRITSLTWIGFASAFFGIVPWWAGLLYALGFVVPILLDIFLPSRLDRGSGVYTSRLASAASPIMIVGRALVAILAAAGFVVFFM